MRYISFRLSLKHYRLFLGLRILNGVRLSAILIGVFLVHSRTYIEIVFTINSVQCIARVIISSFILIHSFCGIGFPDGIFKWFFVYMPIAQIT